MSGRGVLILVVDDNATYRKAVVSILGREGHVTLEAADGAEAFELASRENPQLIISDIVMPSMDGYEFVQRVRSAPLLAETSVIFHTAHCGNAEAHQLAKRCNVTHMLAKPCNTAELLRVVGQALATVARPATAVDPCKDFDLHHRRLITNKLAEKVIELQQEIEIDSTPGHGTVFRLTFMSAEAEAEADLPLVPSAPDRPAPMRLLVVDDDPLLIRSLRAALEGDGHTVVTADSGQEGIDEFCAAQRAGLPFAIVISDLGMPHIDGRRVARAVKAESPTTPVILLTGWGQLLIADGDLPEHVDLVLGKPPKLRGLRAALRQCSQSTGITEGLGA